MVKAMIDNRTTGFQKVSKMLKETVGRCEECGSTENLEIHHKVPVNQGGDNMLSNLMVLCHDCHNKKPKHHWQFPAMFKGMHETFTDEEFERLKQAKDKLTWHEFILQLAERKEQV
jgi:hypothetical protein